MKRILNILQSLFMLPFAWFINMPRFINKTSQKTNISSMPYSFSAPPQSSRRTFPETLARRLSPIYLSNKIIGIPYRLKQLVYKLLNYLLISRKHKALSLLSKVLKNNIHVVDIGAADGIDSRWQVLMNALGDNFKISLFEPEPEAFQRLSDQYRHDRRIECHGEALSENGAELTLNIVEWPRASSIYQANQNFTEHLYLRDHFKLASQSQFQSKRLEDVLIDVELSIIKADVEGYELPILKGAGHLLDTCVGLELEVNFNPFIRIGSPLFSDVETFCRENGFSLVALTTPGYMHYLLPTSEHESKGFVFSADALFLRLPHCVIELIQSKKWSQNRLASTALAYFAYGNFELVFELMRLAVEFGLITEQDVTYKNIMDSIRIYSGYDRIFTSKKIKTFMHWLNGTSENDILDC